MKRYKARVKHDDFRSGIIASTISNAHFKPPDGQKHFTPATWFPSLEEELRPKAAKRMKPEVIKKMLQTIFRPNKVN